MRSLAFLFIVCCLCSAQMDIVYLKEAAINNGAVCLDGSPGIYFFKAGSKTNSTKWVLHMLGGGMCFNDLECLVRSKMYLGSSLYWPAQIQYGGPLSENATYNPDFYDWNHAFFAYCDGAAYAGDVEQPVKVGDGTVYYRGHRILLATLKDLLDNKGLDKATDVFVVGDSSGAMATFFHVDEIKSMMPKSVTRFKAAPLSGIFLDYPNAEGKPVFTSEMSHIFEMQNCTGGVNQKCIAAQPTDKRYKCFFGEYSMEYTESPLFVVGSAYDVGGTACVIGGEPLLFPANTGVGNCSAVPGWGPCELDPPQCTEQQWDMVYAYSDTFRKIIENNPKFSQNGNGLFEYSCHTHAVETTRAWELYSVQGTVMRDAVRKWYFSDNEPSSNHFYKDCVNHESYTCNPVCKIPVNGDEAKELF